MTSGRLVLDQGYDLTGDLIVYQGENQMQLNNFGPPIWVNPGGTAGYHYGGGGLTGIGAVYAMANPYTPNGQVMATSQGLEGTNATGGVTYFINFVNNGPEPSFFNLNVGTF
jgi:hypothetical protein